MVKHGKAPFLECSSKGDTRFSAFYAKVGGRTIEERYQAAKVFADGSTGLSWREAKGRRPVNATAVRELYDILWQRYIDDNPELLDVLVAATGLSDQFGQEGHVCQATSLWEIRKRAIEGKLESFREYEVKLFEEQAKYERAKKRLKRQLEALQKTCEHKKCSFHSDPAGDSSESYHQCINCGKVL